MKVPKVKWEEDYFSGSVFAKLGTVDTLHIFRRPAGWRIHFCWKDKPPLFKSLPAAKRYAIREALKMAKIVTEQLEQLQDETNK